MRTHSEEIARLARRLGAGSRDKVKVHCPLCDPSQSRAKSLDINFLSGSWHCWRDSCGKWGRIDSDLHAHWLRKDPSQAKLDTPLGPPKGFYWLKDIKDSLAARPALSFLAKRGLLHESFGVTVGGPKHGRIIIPVLTQDGSWLGWIGRVWEEKPPKDVQKYVYPRGMKRGEFLYNEQALYTVTDTPILVVEGALDAHHLMPHAVAVLGKHSQNHLSLLLQSERPVCIVYDGDAYRSAFQLAYRLRLSGFPRAGYLKLPPRTDPNELDREFLLELASQACRADTKTFFGQLLEEPLWEGRSFTEDAAE